MARPARPNLFAAGRTARQVRRPRPRRGDAGFTLIELMVAMSIFAVLMTSFGLLFSSSLKAYRFARARTVADQLGSGEIEKARQVSWDNLGTVAGNPPGTLVASQVVTVGAASYTVTRRVELIDDPVPTYGYNTGANYKRVVITVSSPAMTKALSYETLVAPPTQPSLYSGVVKATVLDTFNGVLSGATVAVSGGPSPLRSDATNSAGKASFAALAPTTVAQPNYTVTPSMVGWKLDPADAGAQTMSLSAGQTQTPSYHLYKPVTLTVYVVDLGGAPVTTPTTLTVTNTAGTVTDTRSFSSPTGSLVMSTFGTGDFVPNYAYVFTGSSVGYTTSPAQTSSPERDSNWNQEQAEYKNSRKNEIDQKADIRMRRPRQEDVIEPEGDVGKRRARRDHGSRKCGGILAQIIDGLGPVSDAFSQIHLRPLLSFLLCTVA